MNSVNIFVYPAVTSQSQHDDLISRLTWYFGPVCSKINAIRLMAAAEISARVIVPADLDPAVNDLLPKISENLDIRPPARAREFLNDFNSETDLLLLWNKSNEDDIRSYIEESRKNGRFFEVDPVATKMEGSFLLWAAARHLVDENAIVTQSEQRLAAFLGKVTADKAYVFGTGPSLSEYVAKHKFDDGVCIISNSIVKNIALLDTLRPVAIVAGDPLFHAGVSRYAAEFRRSLVDALERTGAAFFTPLRDYHIYASWLPPHLRERLIAVPFDAKKPYNTNLRQKLYVSPKANVLTLFLLPLAATIANEVRIVGCDGRPLEEDEYFWSHDKAAQFNDEMDTIQRVHPGFFSRDYNDYYAEHCTVTAEAIASIEASGGRVKSMTPSYVPAIRDRYVDAKAEDIRVTEVISVDPDALDNFGHFLSYDGRLREVAEAAGLDFSVFGNRRFDDSRCEGWGKLERVFSLHSWTVGNRPKGPAAEDVSAFEKEIRRAFELRRARGLLRRAAVYMYCGSLPHLEVLLGVADEYPEYIFNINLFWTSFIPYRDASYVSQWSDTLGAALRHPRITVTSPTVRLTRGIAEAFGLAIPVAPHPSTTFPDAALSSLPAPRPLPSKPIVLFPGGMRPEKGFAESCAVAARLGSELKRDIQVILRAYEAPNLPKGMTALRDGLAATDVQIVADDLDDAAFAKFMDSADLVVLPYKAEAFRERTSGLLIDAMLLARPAVVLEGTWLADVVAEGGFGIVAADHPDSILAAVGAALERHAELSNAAANFREKYRETESWSRLLKTIVTTDKKSPVVKPSSPATPMRALVVVGPHAHVDKLHLTPGAHVMAVGKGFRKLQQAGVAPEYYLNLSAAAASSVEVMEDLRHVIQSKRTRRAMVRKALISSNDVARTPLVLAYEDVAKVVPMIGRGAISSIDQAVRWAAELGYKQISLVGLSAPEPDSEASDAWNATKSELLEMGVVWS